MFYSSHKITSKYNFILCMWHAHKRNAYGVTAGKHQERSLLARPSHTQEVHFHIILM
jgi:hypothetical protein